MACKQIFSARLPSGSTATRYISPTWAPYDWNDTLIAVPWRTAGTIRNLVVEHLTAPGGATSYTYTLVRNGSDTALTVTLSGSNTTASNLSTVVTLAVGDLIYWRRTSSGGPATSNQRVSCEFNGTTAAESGYSSLQLFNDTQTWRGSLFSGGQWTTGVGGTGNFEVVAAAGTLTNLAYNLSAAPGSGNSYEISLYLNGVKQDGSGGTPDTRVTIADSATTGLWTGTRTLAAGDYIYVEVVPTSTPTAAWAGVGAKFVATVDGESQFSCPIVQNLPTSSGPYFAAPHWETTSAWSSTEGNHDARSGTSSYVLRSMRVRLSSTVSTGPVAFALRVAGANAGPTVTLASGEQTGADINNQASLVSGNLFNWRYSITGSPGIARIVSLSMVMFALSNSEKLGAFVAGANTTVSAPLAAAFGLDGATNAHAIAGQLKVFGSLGATQYLELVNGANWARLYVHTDGSLKVLFSNGNIVTISNT